MMMTASTAQTAPTSTPSLLDLRNALEYAERQVVRLDRTNIQQFLVQLDSIEQMWSHYDDPSAMSSESARWESLLKRIDTNPKLLTDAAAQVGGLAKLRSVVPPATGPWWHVDRQVADQRSQLWKRMAMVVGLVVLVAAGIWFYNNVVAGDTASTTVDSSQQIERLVEQASWQEALTVVDGARQNAPQDVGLLLWDSVLAERLGNSERAQSSLDQANTLFEGPPAAFWMLVGDRRLQVGNWDGAEEVAQQAFALAPEDAEAAFLLGRIAEARGEMAQANEFYNQAITLAGDSNPELVALIKIRMGMSMQGALPVPGSATLPDASRTITP